MRRLGVLGAMAATMTLVSGCSQSGQAAGDPSCRSHYTHVADAPSLGELRRTLRHRPVSIHGATPRVASLRVVPHPDDDKITINLINPHGHLSWSLDAWRRTDGTWTAQLWEQCIE